MNQYWAAKDTAEVAKEILGKVSAYREFLQQSGMITDLRKSYTTYYKRPHIQDVQQSLKAIHVNTYSSNINHVLTTVTSTRPAWEPRAVNTDLSSQNNTILAAGLLDFYMKEKDVEEKINGACELALFLKEGWISLDWNPTAGEIYGKDPESGKAINTGDVEVETYNIMNMARDFKRKGMNHEWLIPTKLQNKWNLAAKYPDLAEKIVALSSSKADLEFELNVQNAAVQAIESGDDLVPVHSFYHEKTDALPQGRLVILLSEDIVLFDGPLPYKRKYIFGITSAKQAETAFGHTKQMDALPLQDAKDLCFSAILTNISANGVQNFQTPKGSTPTVSKLKDGMNLVEFDPKLGPIVPMDLLKTAPEVYTFADVISNEMDLVQGSPPISKGIAPATMSGTAMALLQQQAILSSSGIQLSYTKLLENVGSGLIELLQTFALVPRIATIAGKSKKSMLKTFTADDLKGIGRVVIDSANPLTKTTAGRTEIANQLLSAPPPMPNSYIKTPEQYIGVLATGNLEALYQHDNANRMLMIAENELLMEGGTIPVLLTDDDTTHILEHQCVLASPEARENPQIVQAVLRHIQEHLDNGRTKDPQLAVALKQVSMFQAPPPPMPPPGAPNVAPVMESPAVVSDSGVNLPKPAQPPQLN